MIESKIAILNMLNVILIRANNMSINKKVLLESL